MAESAPQHVAVLDLPVEELPAGFPLCIDCEIDCEIVTEKGEL